jgi:uncharacterized protein YkwD
LNVARALLLLAAMALAVAGCAPAEQSSLAPPPQAVVLPIAETAPLSPAASAEAVTEDRLAARMIARVNFYRSRHELPPLRWNQALARGAEAHARDMAKHGNFSHLGSDGAPLGARASRAGYRWRRIGENIAGGQATPETAVDDWMQSPGHRANILEPAYRNAGVGHVLRNPDPSPLGYHHYWVLMLGASAED